MPFFSKPLDFLGARKYCQDQGKDIAVSKNINRLEKVLNLVKERVKELNDTPTENPFHTATEMDSWIFAGFTKNIIGQWRDATTDEMLEWDDNWSIGK